MARGHGFAHALAVDEGVDGDDQRVAEGEQQRLAVVQGLARMRQPDQRHAQRDADDAGPGQRARRLGQHGRAAQRDQQRREAAHDRVGQAEFSVLVGAGQREVVADVDHQRGGDVGQRGRRRRADDEQQRQRHHRAEEVHQRGVEFLVAARLDQRVPARVQHRPAQHGSHHRPGQCHQALGPSVSSSGSTE